MGCISLKILTKSLSFREDLNRRSTRNRIANGIPMLDELFTSDNATSGDHKSIPLVLEPQTGSFKSPPKSALEPMNVEMIITWELMAGLEEQVEQKQEVETKSSLILPAKENKLLSRDIYLVDDNAMAFTSGPDIKDMVPSNYCTIEESSSLKDVGGGGCVESPGDYDYVTPKFGNYDGDQSCSEFGEEWKEESILNPELLAAFEEFIQQLELGEERILTNIEGNADKITGKDISAEENKVHMLNDRNRPQFIF